MVTRGSSRCRAYDEEIEEKDLSNEKVATEHEKLQHRILRAMSIEDFSRLTHVKEVDQREQQGRAGVEFTFFIHPLMHLYRRK